MVSGAGARNAGRTLSRSRKATPVAAYSGKYPLMFFSIGIVVFTSLVRCSASIQWHVTLMSFFKSCKSLSSHLRTKCVSSLPSHVARSAVVFVRVSVTYLWMATGV
jgi:hypothetical protein